MAKWIDRLLGAVFLLGAVLKALDLEAFAVQVRAYNVITNAEAVHGVAWTTLCVETALAIALLLSRRAGGLIYAVTSGVLAVFTGLITYAWLVHGLSDCGCFGAFITMPAWVSILKNIVMIAMVAAAWYVTGGKSDGPIPQPQRVLVGGGSLMAVIVAGTFGNWSSPPGETPTGSTTTAQSTASTNSTDSTPPGTPAGPFSQFTFEHEGETIDLGDGEYFVAILNATCSHCMDSVPDVNTLALLPEVPTVVGLVFGEAADFEEFKLITAPEFPLRHVSDRILMFEFLPDASPPPAFHIVHDGTSVQVWTDHPPDVNEIVSNS